MPTVDVQLLTDTTLLAQVNNLRREDTGATIEAGVTVTARVYRDGVAVVDQVLSHVSGGDWEGVVAVITPLTVHERLDVEWVVDGGTGLSRTWWSRNVKVHEGRPELT